MRHTITCSWCHAENDRDERFCEECGHECCVPRMECQCPACVRTEQMRFLVRLVNEETGGLGGMRPHPDDDPFADYDGPEPTWNNEII